MKNTVQFIDNDIIYVEKNGPQTARSMIKLFEDTSKLAMQLRAEGKPVLILSNATNEGDMSEETSRAATGVGKHLSFDKSATYGASPQLRLTRNRLTQEAGLQDKVADFATREEAEAWLLAGRAV